jgi:ABC-type phosphate transport system substrate-binding protein
MTGRRLVLRLCLVATSAIVAITGAVPVGASGGGGPIAQPVLGSGSDTTQFMMAALDQLYLFSPGCAQIPTPSGPTPWLDFSCQSPDPAGTITTENYAHDQVHEAYFLGSSNGIKQLCNKGQAGVAPIDFARSSRASKTSDCTGLHFVAYARDAITWEAFDNGTTASGIHALNNQSGTCTGSGGKTALCLSQAQLEGIYTTCTITNWNQVGGQNVPISIYTPQPGSGTRSTWDTFLGGDSSHCIPTALLGTHQIPENSNGGIPASDRNGAIFPFSVGVWAAQVLGNKIGATIGTVDNVPLTAASIQDGTFPFGRFLYNVFCTATCAGGASSTATVSFFPLPLGVIGSGDSNSDFCRLTVT